MPAEWYQIYEFGFSHLLSPSRVLKKGPYGKPFKISTGHLAKKDCNHQLQSLGTHCNQGNHSSYQRLDVRLAKDNYDACYNPVRKTSNTVFKINYIQHECTFDYRVRKNNIVDPAILYQYIERRQGPREIISMGIEEALVSRVLNDPDWKDRSCGRHR